MSDHNIPKNAKEAFSVSALKTVAGVIGEVEKHTSAEIRVSILEERDTTDANLPIADVARKEFFRLGMEKTSGHNGVLLLILFHERKFYIVGDQGIHDRLHPETWEDVAATLKSHFAHGKFTEGVVEGLQKIKQHLHTALPASQNDVNELTNEVSIR